MQLSTSFPLPENRLAEFCKKLSTVLVFEEGEAFVEGELRELTQRHGWPIRVLGRNTGTLPGRVAMTAAGMYTALRDCAPFACRDVERPPDPHSPVRLSEFPLEPACPFYEVMRVFKDSMDAAPGGIPWVIGEPGCNVRLRLPPFELFDYRVAMGSAIGVAAGLHIGGAGRRTVAIVGDSAFVHSGLSPLAGAAIKGWKALILITDNKVLGVTGCQPGPTAGKPAVDLVAVCQACGVERVERISTSDPSRLRQIFDDGLAADDLRVLVLEYPCNRCVDPLRH
jgi:indolepyruvate ferredoxin oxidoreductase alpha subunit